MASLIQTQLTARALMRKHGLLDAGWTFAFDNAVRRGGCCHYTTKRITMSKKLVPLWDDDMVEQTILHEIAHALAGYEAHHGREWMRVAQSIGFTRGTRTHDNPVPPRPWIQVCPVHGTVGKVHRRMSNRVCGRCYNVGTVSPITYRHNPELDRVTAVR